ncbi:hypothetical protein IV102_29765 [bacterium]|nr:hypothetical protein [bacterium]
MEFIPHPTLNGLYAVGLREDILSIKNDIHDLDQEAEEQSDQAGQPSRPHALAFGHQDRKPPKLR